MGHGSKGTAALCNNEDNLVTFTGKNCPKINLSLQFTSKHLTSKSV